MPLCSAICISPLFLWPFLLQAGDSPMSPKADKELAEACENWEIVALDAFSRRLNGPIAGKEVYARSADKWLAKARRNCVAGSGTRAAQYYQQIITTAKAEMIN